MPPIELTICGQYFATTPDRPTFGVRLVGSNLGIVCSSEKEGGKVIFARINGNNKIQTTVIRCSKGETI